MRDFAPVADVVLSAFGAARAMFGSDWPVCLLASDYAGVYALAASLVAGLSAKERSAVFGGDGCAAVRDRRNMGGLVALTDEAIDKIKQMILSGRVRPGEKLPGKRTWRPNWGCPAIRCARR